jgi:hypothetical protein
MQEFEAALAEGTAAALREQVSGDTVGPTIYSL